MHALYRFIYRILFMTDKMYEKGWYTAEQAEQSKVNAVKQKFNQTTNQ